MSAAVPFRDPDKRRLLWSIVIVVVLAFFVVGPGGLFQEIASGELAPDIIGQMSDGGEFHLHDFKGELILLDFWASWCTWCVQSVPQIEQVRTQFAEGYPPLRVIGVNVGEDARTAREAAAQFGMGYASVLDTDQSITQAYGADGIPLFVLLDTDRTILWRQNGYSDDLADQIIRAVQTRRSK